MGRYDHLTAGERILARAGVDPSPGCGDVEVVEAILYVVEDGLPITDEDRAEIIELMEGPFNFKFFADPNDEDYFRDGFDEIYELFKQGKTDGKPDKPLANVPL